LLVDPERRFVLIQQPHRGFTMIELMVGLAIVGALLAMGFPSVSGMIQNAKLGSATKSYLIGVQTARSEAIRRNLPFDFVLTDSPPSASATGSASGKNWVVRGPDVAGGAPVLLEGKLAQDGSGQANATSVQISGAVTAPSVGAFSGVLTFDGFGAVASKETVQLTVDNPAGGACASAGGPMRCQRIVVRPGGQISVCDTGAAAGDARACQ
jgi:type IV fimbrial biogenesis protein FimT